MTIFVLDASAIIALEDACDGAGVAVDEILDQLTDLAIAAELTCPPSAVKDCLRLGAGEAATRWLRSASGHFGRIDDPWEFMETVFAECPDLLDPDDPDDDPQVAVLALALYVTENSVGVEVIVVTDQWAENPIKSPLGPCAELVGVPALNVGQFLTRLSEPR
jgi:hypothetical protein